MSPWSALAVVPACGLDTLAAAAGARPTSRSDRVRLALALALAEGLAPLVGALAGRALGAALGLWLGRLAGVAVLVVGLREGLAEWRELGEPPGPGRPVPAGGRLWLFALAASLDEVALGFAAGASGLSLSRLVPALALQALVFTWVGLRLGGGLRRLAGRYGEMAAALALCAFGLWTALR